MSSRGDGAPAGAADACRGRMSCGVKAGWSGWEGYIMRRYPALTLLVVFPVFLYAFVYICTHQWMFHPWGMTYAWLAVGATIMIAYRMVAHGDWRYLD